jgi:DNA polymerase I-like protein with 3'-5' exonuclease and polymerase domains
MEADIAARRAELPDWGGVRTENQAGQVQAYLYNVLGLPVQTKRGTSKVTADKEALQKLLDMLDGGHRKIEKLPAEHIDRARDFIHLIRGLRDKSKFNQFLQHPTEWAHPELNPAGTATLRFSCKDPNVQQIPPAAREIFIPDKPGWKLMSVDIRQAEVVALLWFSEQWDVLDQVLNHGWDAHKVTASLLYNKPVEQITKELRDPVKTLVTFPTIYGEQPQTTATRNGVSLKQVLDLRRAFFAALPGVEDYRQRMIQSSMKYGYVESPFGVKREIRAERSVGAAANQACNAPIQNIPAMVTRNAMIRLAAELPPPSRMLTQIHDEILITYPEELGGQVEECVREVVGAPVPQMPAGPIGMGSGLRFGLDIETGEDWGHLE